MRQYIIAYISNSSKSIKDFQNQGKTYFTVVPIIPVSDSGIEVLIQDILSSGAEAVVTDYQLNNREGNLYFNGANVVERMREAREGFPVFILADDRQEAEDKAYDVNIVYDKKSVLNYDTDFSQRVKKQVLKYNQHLEEKEDRLIKLMSQQTPLTQQQESEIMALNFDLEKSIDKQSARAMGALAPSSQDKLKSLLDQVDVMIQEVDKHHA